MTWSLVPLLFLSIEMRINNWLDFLLLPRMNRYPDVNSVLVCDNATIHRSDRVHELCNQAGVWTIVSSSVLSRVESDWTLHWSHQTTTSSLTNPLLDLRSRIGIPSRGCWHHDPRAWLQSLQALRVLCPRKLVPYKIIGLFFWLSPHLHCPNIVNQLAHVHTVTLEKFLPQCCVFWTTLRQKKIWRVTLHHLIKSGIYFY
jgi:hypothetical protein